MNNGEKYQLHGNRQSLSNTLQSNGGGNNGRRQAQRECVALLSDKQFKDHSTQPQDVECELQGDDLNGRPYRMVRRQGQNLLNTVYCHTSRFPRRQSTYTSVISSCPTALEVRERLWMLQQRSSSLSSEITDRCSFIRYSTTVV